MTVGRRYLSGVIAVIAIDLLSKVTNLAVLQVHARGHIGVNVPSEQHAFIEAIMFEKVAAQNKLKIARTVIKNELRSEHDFVEVQARSPVSYGTYDTRRIFAIETLPENFGYFDARSMIEARGQSSHYFR